LSTDGDKSAFEWSLTSHCAFSLESSIREDVKLIKDDPSFGVHVPNVVGMLYEIETGKLKVLDE